MEQTHVLIIGAGPAGLAAAEAAAAQGARVTLCGSEPYLPYWRPRLTHLLAEPAEADTMLIKKPDWFTSRGIEVLTGREAVKVDTATRQVAWADGSNTHYDALVLATGASCFVPAIAGAKPNALRSYDDAVRLRREALEAGRAVVIGGGLLGLETAWELNAAGVDVTVIERGQWLIPRQLNREGGDYLQCRLAECGLTLHVGQEPSAFQQLFGGACVIVAAGIRPNTALAQSAGIACGRAVTVDERMATSVQSVFACGDVAEFEGRNWGLMPTAQEQGKVAGANAAGGSAVYTDTPPSPMLKIGSFAVFSTGDLSGEGAVALTAEDNSSYTCLMLQDGALAGAALIGNTASANKLKKAVAEKRMFPDGMNVEDVLKVL